MEISHFLSDVLLSLQMMSPIYLSLLLWLSSRFGVLHSYPMATSMSGLGDDKEPQGEEAR